jgi:GAF domain-containing protein
VERIMTDDVPAGAESVDEYRDVYVNAVIGATPNPLITDPDDIDEQFATDANRALGDAVELLRRLIPSHQSAAAIIVQEDWSSMRKFFSLSPKYAAWSHFRTPAVGRGTHRWLAEQRKSVRLTQAELEAHPAWLGFGTEADRHPPMRGWLAAPLLDSSGTCWGMLQLSDRLTGEYTAGDEAALVRFTDLLTLTLESLWSLRNARKAAREKFAR